MNTTHIVYTAIMPIFLIIGAGALVRRIGWLNEEADRSLMAVVVNLLYPALIFSLILGNDALREPANLLLPPAHRYGHRHRWFRRSHARRPAV